MHTKTSKTGLLGLVFSMVWAAGLSALAPPEPHQKTADTAVHIYTLPIDPVIMASKKSGFGYDMLEYMMADAGLQATYHEMPWKRARRMVDTTAEAFLFPVARTPDREDQYHWSIPMIEIRAYLVTLDQEISPDQDIKTLRVGVARDSIFLDWLRQNDFQNIFVLPEDGDLPVKLLAAGRFDAWFAEKRVATLSLEKAELSGRSHFSDMMTSFSLYLASNKDTPSQHIGRLQIARKKLDAHLAEHKSVIKTPRHELASDQWTQGARVTKASQ